MYKEKFKKLVAECVKTNTFIGYGNPNAKILFVGKEGSNEGQDENSSNRQKWKRNIDENNELEFSYLLEEAFSKSGHTWKKYQKLHDYIFVEHKPEDRKFNFHERVFTSEMNIKPNKNTEKAKKDVGFADRLRTRKSDFLTTDFVQDFKVIILVCSDYIQNIGEGKEREIDTIFGVAWDKPFIIEHNNKKYGFDTHYSKEKTKLVIHCRQLSGAIPEKYLEKMGEIVREFMRL